MFEDSNNTPVSISAVMSVAIMSNRKLYGRDSFVATEIS